MADSSLVHVLQLLHNPLPSQLVNLLIITIEVNLQIPLYLYCKLLNQYIRINEI